MSSESQALITFLETFAVSQRFSDTMDWDAVAEVLLEFQPLGSRRDVDAEKVAFLIRKLQNAIPEDLFLAVTGQDAVHLDVTGRTKDGRIIRTNYARDWEHILGSPVDLDKADYPPETWPLWCNGRQTVYLSHEYSPNVGEVRWKIVVNNHGGK